MVTTHLGKFPQPKIDNIRDAIFGSMMSGYALLNTEVLYYFLVDKIGVGKLNATQFALKAHNGGKQVSSRSLKDILLDINYELEQRQVTQFVKRFLKSTRVEVLDKTPTTWQMNGFSTHERPYFAGYERGGPEIVAIQTSSKNTFVELVNRRNELKGLIQQKEQSIKQDGFVPKIINERNTLKIEFDNLTNKLLSFHS